MKAPGFRAMLAAVFAVFSTVTQAAPIIEGSLAADDLAAVNALAGEVDSIWNARRADELAAMYTENGSLQFVSQNRGVSTRAGILDYFTKSFAQLTPDLRHVTVVDRIVVVSPTVVLADSSVALTSEAEGREPRVVRRFAVVNVVVKEGDAWKIAAVRTHLLPQEVTATASAPARNAIGSSTP
jgi:uncharacterized protein (TIGR02246 family)